MPALIARKNIWIIGLLFVFVLAACASPTSAPTSVVLATNTSAVTETSAVITEESPTAIDTATTVPDEITPTVDEPTATTAEGSTEVSFSRDVLPILEASCLKCHGGERTAEGFDVNTYETVMAGSEDGAVIVAGDAENSKLFTLIHSGKMPKKASKLPDEQIELIRNWIDAGALDN